MRVAILSRGPSCALTWPMAPRYSYDIVMAINCAIDLWQADWLIAGDPVTLRKVRGKPRIGAVYRSDLLQPGEAPPECPPLMIDACVMPSPWPLSWSIETAVQFAVEWICADWIDIYGHDLKPEVCGRPAVHAPGREVSDTPERYREEAKATAKTFDHYRQRATINVVGWSDDA